MSGEEVLRRIGEDLHAGRTVCVHEGGRVWPDTLPPLHQPSGHADRKEVTPHGPEARAPGPAGPAAGSREGTAGDGSAEGSGTAAAAASLLRAAPIAANERDNLVGAIAEYCQLRPRVAPPGVWLSGPVQPVAGLPDVADVVVVYPFDQGLLVKAWAWWEVGVWVGPRHTNYGDGSICSYEVADHIWDRGKPFLDFLDLTSGWLARHLHLRYFGFWPGDQVLHTAFERMREQRRGELCGGCRSGKLYDDCHRPGDLELPALAVLREFRQHFGEGRRRPPQSYHELVTAASVPPPHRLNAAVLRSL